MRIYRDQVGQHGQGKDSSGPKLTDLSLNGDEGRGIKILHGLWGRRRVAEELDAVAAVVVVRLHEGGGAATLSFVCAGRIQQRVADPVRAAGSSPTADGPATLPVRLAASYRSPARPAGSLERSVALRPKLSALPSRTALTSVTALVASPGGVLLMARLSFG